MHLYYHVQRIMVLIFFLKFCCIMTLLSYLGVGAGARPVARTGAGAGTGVGIGVEADTNTCMNTDLAFLWYLGWDMSPVDFWKEIISIADQNKIDPASLAVTDQLICTQGKRRLTLDHVLFHDRIFQLFCFLLLFVTCDTNSCFFMGVPAPDTSWT